MREHNGANASASGGGAPRAVIDDVLIVGAGPAGTVAATILARAGVRVRLVDRATFPREKLCGDTVNPGTLARLRRLNLAAAIDRNGLPVRGMLITGEGGIRIEGRYPRDLSGRALSRAEFDWSLLQHAVEAGAAFDPAVAVRSAIVDETPGGPLVQGVVIGSNGSTRRLPARVTIAADGRRSTLAFGLGLARHPARPRRWAIGGYFEATPGASLCTASLGEMHIRRGRYIGVAPVAGGLTNVCVVKPWRGGEPEFGDPAALLRHELERDDELRERFAGARLVRPPTVLGPLAVDATGQSLDGLILAGDAAGFIDPMTGDGLRFAVRGGELAAAAALNALDHGWQGVHAALATERQNEFRAKWRFNRGLRALVASPLAIRLAAAGARFSPQLVRNIVAHAGDCDRTEDLA